MNFSLNFPPIQECLGIPAQLFYCFFNTSFFKNASAFLLRDARHAIA